MLRRKPLPARRGVVTRAMFKANREADQRLRHTNFLRENLNKVFPDHWSFMLGEIAMYSLVVLVLTGTYLTFFFDPSETKVVYDGRYVPLHGVEMSSAYESTLKICFDVRGGLLIRQIHHWAALLFVAAIAVHMARIFFTAAFRKPRDVNWMIGLCLITLSTVEGFAGYSLGDDLLSGTGLRIAASIMQSIPVVGTWLTFLVFGGEYPGTEIIGRLYIAHVLLIPGLIIGLVAAHIGLVIRQKHTDFPRTPSNEKQVSGSRFFPVYATKSVGLFFIIAGVLAGLGGLVQINPIWQWGPYVPSEVQAYSQPDWYMMWIDGALRLFPAWEIRAAGHTVPPLFWPGVVMPVTMLLVGFAFPALERKLSGDYRRHNVLDRPRNAPVRTAFGASVIAFWGVLELAGMDDIIAHTFDVPIEWVVWGLRSAFFAFPFFAFVVTNRACHALQHRERRTERSGIETGRAVRAPTGEYVEVTELPTAEPPAEEAGAVPGTR
jgi:ubiquinol-cytochrome c reductase cytochrome b subunit